MPRQHERDHHQAENDERLLQQTRVHDRLARDHVHHARLRRRRRLELPPPDELNQHGLRGEDDQDNGGEIQHEGVEVEPHLRADQDVRRVADQRRGAADVGGKNLRK